MVIYKVTNKVNNKIYIGQTTTTFEIRKATHIRELKLNRKNSYFYNSIKKYGIENFEWEIIEKCDSIDELNLAEEWYIRKFDSYYNGYNMTFGGGNNCGYKFSEEHRRKLSEAHKGSKHHFFGKVHPNKGKKIHTEKFKKEAVIWLKKANVGRRLSEEHKRKISKVHKGKKLSKEHIEKLRISNIGRKHTEETKEKLRLINIGKKLSEETKQKIGEASKGRIHSEETKEKMVIAKKKNWEDPTYRKKISEALSGENNPMYGKTGDKNPFYGKVLTDEQYIKQHGFMWKIIDNNGNEKLVPLLTRWCEENNILYSNMKYHFKIGDYYKGFKIEKEYNLLEG